MTENNDINCWSGGMKIFGWSGAIETFGWSGDIKIYGSSGDIKIYGSSGEIKIFMVKLFCFFICFYILGVCLNYILFRYLCLGWV